MRGRLPAFEHGLIRPLAGSLALHLILLLALLSPPRPLTVLTPAAPLHAVLAMPAPGAGAVPSPDGSRSSRSPAESNPPALARARGEARTALRRNSKVATPVASRLDGALAQQTIAAAAVPSGKAIPQAGPSAEAVRQYVLLLVPEMRRWKRYPAPAQAKGREGTAEVRLRFAAARSLPIVALGQSSGIAALDEQAMLTVGEAARRVALPESLRGRDISISVPVQFHLDD